MLKNYMCRKNGQTNDCTTAMFSDKFYIAGLGEERGESSTAKVPIQ
jgi:hypothetical protein